MKKKTERYSESYSRKWKSAWVILVLIFSIISIPAAGEEDNTGNGTSIGQSPEQVIIENDSSDSSENAGMSPENETEEIGDTDSKKSAGPGQESTVESGNGSEGEENEIEAFEPGTKANSDIQNNDAIIPESPENEPEPQEEASGSAGDQEGVDKGQDPDKGLNNGADNGENEAGNPESRTGADNGTQYGQSRDDDQEPEIVEENNTDNQKTRKENSDSQTGQNSSAQTQETEKGGSDLQTGQHNNTENQKNTTHKPVPDTEVEKGIENPPGEEVNPEQKTGEENASGSVEEGIEHETGVNDDIDEQGNTEENQDTGRHSGTKQQENIVKVPEQKQKAGNNIASSEDGGANVKLKEKVENGTDNKKSDLGRTDPDVRVYNRAESPRVAGIEERPETGVCNCTKVPESKKLIPEVKTIQCNWAGNLGNQEVKPEIKVYYLANNTGNGTGNETVIPEIEQKESSWNNLKFILSYRYSLRSFYTVNESVKISYQGSETLRHENVNIYLVKAYDPGFPGKTILNGTDGNEDSLEEILSNNTEFYVQIPAVLNGDGDLPPLTLGPLSAGSYRVLITLAGNETNKPDQEKEILLANYFDVLEYRMEAKVPYTIEEGENLEVNLNLRNAPARTGYTYWAVLLRADTCENENIPARAAVLARPVVNGVDIIRNLEAGLTGNESGAGKDGLKNEIQNFIGKENGTISIGEEDQSTLSLTGMDLPPGDYILFAGAHEKGRGLAGLAQKELRISSKDSPGASLSSLSETYLGNISSMKSQYSSFMGISSIFGISDTFISEEIKPHIQTKAIAHVIRNPPKIPSFLLGFTGTLLIGLAVLRKRK
ncbi:MAG: TIGR04279 domain-containing protein [Methanosarcina flavescens]